MAVITQSTKPIFTTTPAKTVSRLIKLAGMLTVTFTTTGLIADTLNKPETMVGDSTPTFGTKPDLTVGKLNECSTTSFRAFNNQKARS